LVFELGGHMHDRDDRNGKDTESVRIVPRRLNDSPASGPLVYTLRIAGGRKEKITS